ncbi:MAG TPA: Rne/Rng family ribonuclease [Kiritimatiellia bacterium]|jgi:ribonuclease G|nr:MAG: Ribonuclease G [Verrucomicrobia bacterium ADurb.Bin018]HOE00916.1 Rne/Rng family ribonuclease [Kiritimatiellia bacterium]HOE36347.1 Rne/Rng family ribonuclease [Kiritimatiellia bacterium]HOR73769.1 Rne/Rng family ribonuclease [Kiritimatiellia bacterium]HOU58414.1 Rne/Rng family ribonuclease [Kiritimatiellia bacterium]
MWEWLKMIGLGKKIKREIIVNAESLETRVAVMEDGHLEEFAIERPTEERIVGSIFKGRIQNIEDGLQAAFVDIGLKKNAFIHFWDMIPEDAARLEAEEGVAANRPRKKKTQPGEMAKQFPPGSEIIVQVTKGPIGTKGSRVTANLSIPGRYLVMMPGSKLKGVSRKIEGEKERARLKKALARLPIPSSVGLIIRTSAEGVRASSLARDLRGLLDIWQKIEDGIKNQSAPCCLYHEPDLVERVVRDSLTAEIDRIVIDSRAVFERIRDMTSRISRRVKNRVKLYDGAAPIFEHFEVEKQLENAFRRKVWLKSGGYLIFDETEALVAIDVNTGRHKGGQNQEESILQVNTEAAGEVARQLRLRNIGGLVVIDFIDMKSRKNQSAVYKTLKEALQKDKARTNVLPVSQLGLVEMTRQRMEESLRAANYADCPYCHGRGKVLSTLSMSVRIQRRILEVIKKNQHRGEIPLRIAINPMIMERLRKEDEQVLIDLEKRGHTQLTFVSDVNLHVEDFRITHRQTGEVFYEEHD